jgi:hypothetical protein
VSDDRPLDLSPLEATFAAPIIKHQGLVDRWLDGYNWQKNGHLLLTWPSHRGDQAEQFFTVDDAFERAPLLVPDYVQTDAELRLEVLLHWESSPGGVSVFSIDGHERAMVEFGHSFESQKRDDGLESKALAELRKWRKNVPRGKRWGAAASEAKQMMSHEPAAGYADGSQSASA